MVHGGNHAAPPPGRQRGACRCPRSWGPLAPGVRSLPRSPAPGVPCSCGSPLLGPLAAPRLALRLRPLLTGLLTASPALSSLPAPCPRLVPSVAQRVHLPVYLVWGPQAASLRKRGAWPESRVRGVPERRPRAALAFPPVGFFTAHVRPRPPGEVPAPSRGGLPGGGRQRRARRSRGAVRRPEPRPGNVAPVRMPRGWSKGGKGTPCPRAGRACLDATGILKVF